MDYSSRLILTKFSLGCERESYENNPLLECVSFHNKKTRTLTTRPKMNHASRLKHRLNSEGKMNPARRLGVSRSVCDIAAAAAEFAQTN
jgi:hypothetical protein